MNAVHAQALQIEEPWPTRILPWLALFGACFGLMGSGWKFVAEPKIENMVNAKTEALDEKRTQKLSDFEKRFLAEIRDMKGELKSENQRLNDKMDKVIWHVRRD